MTVRAVPTFLQAEQHPAENVRLMTAGVFGSTAGAFLGGVGASDPGHGIVRVGPQLSVSQKGTPDMSVDVAAGGAFIRGSSATAQGVYHFYNDAVVNLTIGTADATNARRDLVVAQVRDSAYAGSDDDARLFIVQGTPSGSPADPAVPDDCLVLARVTVPALAASIVNANITDTRTVARPWNSAWGVLGVATKTSNQDITTTTPADISGLSVPFQEVVGRRIKTTFFGNVGHATGGSGHFVTLRLTDGASTLQEGLEGIILNSRHMVSMSFTYSVVSSPIVRTHKMQGFNDLSTKNTRIFAAATFPATLIVEDVGPA